MAGADGVCGAGESCGDKGTSTLQLSEMIAGKDDNLEGLC
jgi:hypothetical protein